jgi:hypothetical protein
VIPFYFIVHFLLLTLNRTQMTSHGSSDEGNAQSHTDGLAREGFPCILWEVLQGAGYTTPPQYAVQLFEKHRVHRCTVRMTLEPHPLQSGWRSLDSESFGYRAEDTIEAIALHGLTTFYGFHPLELSTHPIGLFPAEKEDDPMWKDRVEHTKITLDNREELVVDLSTEMVEKDLQVEQLSNEIQELEELVGTGRTPSRFSRISLSTLSNSSRKLTNIWICTTRRSRTWRPTRMSTSREERSLPPAWTLLAQEDHLPPSRALPRLLTRSQR